MAAARSLFIDFSSDVGFSTLTELTIASNISNGVRLVFTMSSVGVIKKLSSRNNKLVSEP